MTTNEKSSPPNKGDAAPEDAAQELIEHRDLQNAQIGSMTHIWDNPDDEVWNNLELSEVSAAQPGRDMNASEALTDSQLDLYDRMSEISEDCYCAQWIRDNEYAIWDALQGRDSSHGLDRMDPRLLRRCKLLSEEVGGWIYWADDRIDPTLPREAFGARFAPMAQWLAMVNERHNLVAAPKT